MLKSNENTVFEPIVNGDDDPCSLSLKVINNNYL